MEFSGLTNEYPSNIKLSDWDRLLQLKQWRRLQTEPKHQLAVIKMNSTYLESVDKWFAWKGFISTIATAVLCILGGGGGTMAALWFLAAVGLRESANETWFLVANGLAMTLVVSAICTGAIWLLRKESFAFTHYPIRFNRKTRMVHVFRTNGTVLTVPWDDIFFSMGRLSGECEIRGYVLDIDKATILETFVLSYMGVLSDNELHNTTTNAQGDYVRGHWEFIRRYMEDGPESVSEQVQFCMPVDKRRERPINGVHRLLANYSGGSFVSIALAFPFCLLIAIFRAFAMETSKIPQWPKEIEAGNTIDPDDPYAIEGDVEGGRIAVFPAAACAAGVGSTGASGVNPISACHQIASD